MGTSSSRATRGDSRSSVSSPVGENTTRRDTVNGCPASARLIARRAWHTSSTLRGKPHERSRANGSSDTTVCPDRSARIPGHERRGRGAGQPAAAGARAGQAKRRDRGRVVRADADARPRQSLFDLRDVGAPAHLRPARRRHERLEVHPRARGVLAARQQHDVALHAPEGRDLPRRHALQCRQRRVHPEARPRQHQAHQVVRLPGPRLRGEGRRLRRRRHVQAPLRLPARPSDDAGHAPAERGARARRRSSPSRSAPGPSASRAGPTGTRSR